MQANPEWQTAVIRDVTLKTLMWNPKKEPRELIKYVDVSAICRERSEIHDVNEYTSSSVPSRAKKIIRQHDTIFATIRPGLKRISKVPENLDNELASTAFCVLRPKTNNILPDFLFYTVSTDQFIDAVVNLETGASYPAVRDKDILNQTILLPPLSEQREITIALNLIRTALQHQFLSLNIVQKLKHTAMCRLFTEGLRTEAQQETAFGLAPASWPLLKMGDLTLLTQYGLSLRGQPNGQYPILRMNCQDNGKVLYRDLQFVDLDLQTFTTFQLNIGDILFNRTNSFELVGRSAIVTQNTKAVFASYLIRIKVNNNIVEPDFLNHFLNWNTTQSELKKLASRGVSQANISASKLKDFSIPIPTLDEQQKIVAILDVIDQKIDLHKRKLTTLNKLFKTLLHKLMTGAVRVSELDLSTLGRSIDAFGDTA